MGRVIFGIPERSGDDSRRLISSVERGILLLTITKLSPLLRVVFQHGLFLLAQLFEYTLPVVFTPLPSPVAVRARCEGLSHFRRRALHAPVSKGSCQ